MLPRLFSFVSLVMLLPLLAGCEEVKTGSATSPSAAPQLRVDRRGAEDSCSFETSGNLVEIYACRAQGIQASVSATNKEATITFSPKTGAGTGKTTLTGMVRFDGLTFKEGTYEFKDFKAANFAIKYPEKAFPSWLAQKDPNLVSVGDIRFKVSSALFTGTDGDTTYYLVHGVFEANLIPVTSGATQNVLLHGEF